MVLVKTEKKMLTLMAMDCYFVQGNLNAVVKKSTGISHSEQLEVTASDKYCNTIIIVTHIVGISFQMLTSQLL